MANKKTKKLQTLIFDKKVFKSKRQIKDWVKKNEFKLPKKKDPIRKYDTTYHVRQREPSRFKKTTFRTFPIFIGKKKQKGVQGVYGYLK